MTASLAARSKQHACLDCAALPPRPADYTPATHDHRDYQPLAPLKTTGGPRSQRCTRHRRLHEAAVKASRRATRTERVYSVGRDEGDALWAFQGGKCACGRVPRMRSPEMDHDHDCCPAGQSCGRCVRGWLCRWCNQELLGFLGRNLGGTEEVAAALLRLASHLLDPPLARMRRGEQQPYELDMDAVRALLGGAREEEEVA